MLPRRSFALEFEIGTARGGGDVGPCGALVLSPARACRSRGPGACLASLTAASQGGGSSGSRSFRSTLPPGSSALTLPALIEARGHRRQYVWDGHRVVAVPKSLGASSSRPLKPTYTATLRRLWRGMQTSFFPPEEDVTSDYWTYIRWRAAHRLFSSMSGVFATHSMLLAVGVGARRSLAGAATVNWVLKDGLGRLGRLSAATRFGESFDADLKRFRFVTSVMFCGALALEYATPLFPRLFLPLAALANVGKNVGLATYVATQPAFHQSLARRGNLADISAKSQAQQMVWDSLGLALAVAAGALCRRSEQALRLLPLVAFPVLCAGDLCSIAGEMRSVQLRTLNRERADILVRAWIAGGGAASSGSSSVPSMDGSLGAGPVACLTPAQVSRLERIFFPPDLDLAPCPLRMGPLDHTLRTPEDVRRFLRASSDGARYFLTAQEPDPTARAGPLARLAPSTGARRQGAIRASLRSDARSRDALLVVLHAGRLRERLAKVAPSGGSWAGRVEELVGECGEASRRELEPFVSALESAGWTLEPFALSSSERKRYTACLPATDS